MFPHFSALLTAHLFAAGAGLSAVSFAASPTATGVEFFEKKIRPVLVEHCYECHSTQGKKQKGGLLLDTKTGWMKGGDSGPVIVAGKPDDSLLLEAIRYHEKDLRMPPPAKDGTERKLPDAVINDFAEWVKSGATLPEEAKPVESGPHWAFQPVQNPPVPDVSDQSWPKNTVDRFLLAKMEARGVKPVGPADARTLLRRATYDLTGLPPTPEEAEAFASDKSPDAFAKVVDRLLASPAYGERWGRHWLDIVRYADTAGENSDFPVPQAWRYRNWVIDAFNRDKPYDAFIREQIAGDILAAKEPPARYAELVTATGFVAISRRFGGAKDDRDFHLSIDDTLDTVGKSVLGLTIGCARCHNHKYDPITTGDYYGLYGIFSSTRYSFPGNEEVNRSRDLVPLLPPDEAKKVGAPYEAEVARLDAELKAREAELAPKKEELKKLAAQPALLTASGEFPNGGAQDFSAGQGAAALGAVQVKRGEMLLLSIGPKMGHGADSTLVEFEIAESGGASRVWNVTREVVPDFYEKGAGFQHSDSFGNKGVWSFVDASPEMRLLTTFEKDGFKTPGVQTWKLVADTPAAFVNVTDGTVKATTVTIPPRALALHPSPGSPIALAWQSPIDGVVSVRGRVADLDAGGGDGIAWKLEHRAGFGPQLAASIARDAAKKQRDDFFSKPPPIEYAYAAVEGEPKNARIMRRGEPADPGPEVPRKFLDVLGGQKVAEEKAGSGRRDLAEWLTAPANPLTARVMANRLWQWHFGSALVATPNDFGTRGAPPSNPELLDHLATKFIESGWSMKAMHRLIMLSAAYQLSSGDTAANRTADPNNELHWRFAPRRLTAEELRDTLLALSGELDREPGGPHPFPPMHTWGFTQHAPFSALYESNKRTVYTMTQRIKRHPFLALFDGPDPNASTPVREASTVPTQALFFMNDPFVHAQAEKFAARVLAAGSDDSQRLAQAFRLGFQRAPRDREAQAASAFLAAYQAELTSVPAEQRARSAWKAYARALLASNELLHVD